MRSRSLPYEITDGNKFEYRKIEIENNVLELSIPNVYIAREKKAAEKYTDFQEKRGRGRAEFPGNYKIDE